MFRKDMEPNCSYCTNGTVLTDGNVICRHYGVISPAADCRKFKYAPLKRIPQRPAVLPDFDPKDFSVL